MTCCSVLPPTAAGKGGAVSYFGPALGPRAVVRLRPAALLGIFFLCFFCVLLICLLRGCGVLLEISSFLRAFLAFFFDFFWYFSPFVWLAVGSCGGSARRRWCALGAVCLRLGLRLPGVSLGRARSAFFCLSPVFLWCCCFSAAVPLAVPFLISFDYFLIYLLKLFDLF